MFVLWDLIFALLYWASFGLASHSLADTDAFRKAVGRSSALVSEDRESLPAINAVVFVMAVMMLLFLSFVFGMRLSGVLAYFR